MLVVNIEETRSACPTLWTGSIKDGRSFDAKYRYGFLSINVGTVPIFEEQIGDEFDGIMSREMLESYMQEIGFIFNE